jgi:hypothetical protein
MQRSEWLALFASGGFDLVEEDSRQVDISGVKVAKRWEGMDRRDLASTVLRVAMRKREVR